jgi:hypothetical protein
MIHLLLNPEGGDMFFRTLNGLHGVETAQPPLRYLCTCGSCQCALVWQTKMWKKGSKTRSSLTASSQLPHWTQSGGACFLTSTAQRNEWDLRFWGWCRSSGIWCRPPERHRPEQSHTPQSHNPRPQYWNTKAPILGDEMVIIMQDARRKYRRYKAWMLRASWYNPRVRNNKFVQAPLASCYSVQHAMHFKLHVNLLTR